MTAHRCLCGCGCRWVIKVGTRCPQCARGSHRLRCQCDIVGDGMPGCPVHRRGLVP